jgi:Putative DNA-binding domain
MASLRELQIGFMDAIFAAEPSGFGLEVKEDGIPGEKRLDVYRNNVFGGLTQALRLTYPAVHVLVGEAFFNHMTKGYIRDHVSISGDLTHFGSGFPAFLEGLPLAGDLPYLPDMAYLEWLCHLSYYAMDYAPLALERLASLPPERYDSLRFRLHPACYLFASGYPIHQIWRICQPDHAGNETVDISLGGANLIVQRTGLRVMPRPLGCGEFALLETFSAGQRFAEACSAALKAEPELDLPRSLQSFVAQGIVVDFHE